MHSNPGPAPNLVFSGRPSNALVIPKGSWDVRWDGRLPIATHGLRLIGVYRSPSGCIRGDGEASDARRIVMTKGLASSALSVNVPAAHRDELLSIMISRGDDR